MYTHYVVILDCLHSFLFFLHFAITVMHILLSLIFCIDFSFFLHFAITVMYKNYFVILDFLH
jgi:hypothetical protein